MVFPSRSRLEKEGRGLGRRGTGGGRRGGRGGGEWEA